MPGDAFGLKLQIIEGDRLSNPNYKCDSATLSGGVELDSAGAPVRYHILTAHPGDVGTGFKRDWTPYDAFTDDGRRRVLHLYRKLRPGQHRGVPYLSPVIETLKQLGRYTDAEVMAAVVSGMFTVFIKTEPGLGLDMSKLLDADGKTASGDGDIGLGYGAMVDLKPGESIEDANPGRPNQAFDPFVMALCRQIGMALELPYEVLVKHFTASYSAARAALLEAWGFYRSRRAWLVRQLCHPVYEAWMWEAVARGYLYAPGFTSDPLIRQAYLQAEWIGPTQGQIDPVKEVQAAHERLGLKLTTRSEECMALVGNDWEAKVPQIKREEGLVGAVDSKDAAAQTTEPQPAAPDEGDKEKE
jgi:lambda family phage portal protein